MQALAAAAPSAATVRDSNGLTALQLALRYGYYDAARHLLLGCTDALLEGLAEAHGRALPPGGLYTDLAASRPLTAAQWGRVPAPARHWLPCFPRRWPARTQRRACWSSTCRRGSASSCALLRCAWCGRSGGQAPLCRRS